MKLVELDITQPRVASGSNAQNVVVDYLHKTIGNDFELVSVADKSSKKPDIIANVKGHETHFEIKGRDKPTSPVKIYEKSIGRGEKDRTLDSFARVYSNGQANNFTQLVDLLRKNNPSVGFPGDSGVVARAGKFYISTDDSATKTSVRRNLIDSLKQQTDDYFIILTRSTHTVSVYDIGSTNSYIEAPRIPNIKTVRVETYGGSYKHRMRIAIKVIFVK